MLRRPKIKFFVKVFLVAWLLLALTATGFPVDFLLSKVQNSKIVDQLYLSHSLDKVVDNFKTPTAKANPGTRVRTVEFFAGQYASATLANQNAIISFPTQTFQLAETSADIIDAYVEVSAQIGAAVAATYLESFIYFDACVPACTPSLVAFTTTAGLGTNSGESQRITFRAKVTTEAEVAAYVGAAANRTFQVGYCFDTTAGGGCTGTTSANIQGANAKLVMTYTYDDTSATQTNTVIYPLDSGTDIGSKIASQASCTIDTNCPTFSYNAEIPEITTQLSQFFHLQMSLDATTTTDFSTSSDIGGNPGGANDTAVLSEMALSGNGGWLNVLRSGTAGYANNSAQSLEVSTNSVLYMMGGENYVTYTYSNAAATKTKTTVYPVGEVQTTGSVTKSALTGPTVYFPESGVTIKKAWFRIQTSDATTTATTLNITSKVGNNVESASRNYSLGADAVVTGSNGFFTYIIPSSEYAEMALADGSTGKAVQMTAAWAAARGAVSAELLITYTYTGDSSGYNITQKLFAGQQTTAPAAVSLSLGTVDPKIAEASNVTITGASLWMSAKGAAFAAADELLGSNLNASSCTATGSSTTDDVIELDNLGFWKSINGVVTTNDLTTYIPCYDTAENAVYGGTLTIIYKWVLPPSLTLTIAATAGSKVANIDSGATSASLVSLTCITPSEANCAAFKMTTDAGGTATVTSIKITETGTVNANSELTNPTIFWDTDAACSDGTSFGSMPTFAADQTANISGSLAIPASSTRYFCVKTDFLNGTARPDGGLTVNFSIAAATDVVSDATESGSGTLAGTTTVRPNVTSFTNSTEGGLTDGARTTQTISIAGHGFGTTCNGTTNKVEIGTYVVSCTGATFTDTSITIAVDAGVNVYGGTTTNGLLVTIGSTADDARSTFYVYPDITSLSPTAATGAKEGDNVVITGTKFRAAQGTGSVQFTNCNTTSGTIVGWGDTSITVTVPAGVLDTDDSCDILVTRDTDAKTKTSTGYVILPSITSITVPTAEPNAAREYLASDSDGVITVLGTHFGAAGTVTVLGSAGTQQTTGTCTGTAYQATCVGLQIPTAIADSTYTGNIIITRTSDSKAHTYGSTFRILPRIASTSPVNLKAGRNDTISITGDHLCQSGSCPTAFSVTNKVSFQGGEVTSGSSTWTHTSIPSVVVSVSATDGAMTITSNTSYTSNGLTFDIKFAPTTPTNSVPANGATGQSQNPTLTGLAFSDGADGDSHANTNWEITPTSGNYSVGTVVWTRTSTGAEITIIINTTNGTFANALSGQTQLACGTTYWWHVRYKDNAGIASAEWSAFSAEFSFSTSACIPTLTIGVTPGSKVTSVASGATSQYAHDTACTGAAICAAFTLTISTGSDTVTSIKITETGTAVANTDLANLALFSDTDGNWADAGAETQYGTTVAAFTSEAATVSGSLAISSGTTYYFYVRYDLAKSGVYPKGGQTVNFQIAADADVTVSGSPVKTGSPQSLAGTQTVLPNATGITTTVNSDGGRSGDSITISGFGFGAPTAGANREDCTTATVDIGCVKFIVGGTTNVANANITSWSNTSVVFTIAAALATEGGASAVEMRAANQADTTPLTFYVYPKVTSLTVPTAEPNAGREYDAGDSDGVITVLGDHFGAAGTVTVLGSAGTQQTTGTCTGTAYQATCVGLQIPTAIADSTYTGNIIITRTSDSKAHTYGSTFRILPRIASNTAASGIPGDRIKILGDHFCETGTCPVSPNRSAASDNVVFGATQAADSDFVNSGATPCSGNAQGWTHAELCVNVPATTPEGSQPTLATSNSYTSNTKAFSRSTTAPDAPTNLRQFKANGTTSLGTGATTNESTAVFKADISATVAVPMILQVEVDPSGAGFDGSGITDGSGCTCTSLADATATVNSLTTGGKQWRARVKNTTTSETSAWVEFQSGTGADFTVDVNGPVITFAGGDTCAGSQSALGTNGVTISWSLDESGDGQVEYSTNVDLTSSTNYPSPAEASNVSHVITLSNLSSNTTYYYKVKSTDAATNLSSRPTGQPFCSFTTSSVSQPGKTTSFYVAGATGSISAATNYYFTLVAPETSPSVKSAFVEVTGIVSGGSNPITVKVNGVASKAYSVSASSATQYRFVYEITSPNSEANLNLNDANPCTNGASAVPPCNKLTVTPGSGMSVNITSARIIVNYAYTP